MYKLLLAIFTFSLMQFSANAQYVISGRVTNSQSNEGIPFANVYIKGTNTKVYTDFEGYYKFRLKHNADFITVNCLGYAKLIKKVDKNVKEQAINFALTHLDTTLKQKASLIRNEGKAIDIIHKVILHKNSYSKSKLNAYGYEAYTKIQMHLVDIGEKFRSRKFFRPFKFMFNNIDSSTGNKPFLPFFISETVSDYYFQKMPLAGHEIIKASKISGIDEVGISQFLGTSFGEADINGDYIVILKREFLSPIANVGIASYNYFLEDTEMIDKFKCYRIRFIPKSETLLRLEGVLWVADSSFAVKQISLKVRGSSNVNMINSISLFKEFVPAKDSVWMLKTENLTINFYKPGIAPQMVLIKNASYRNFAINTCQPNIDSLSKEGRPSVIVNDSAGLKSKNYWGRVRHAAGSTGNEDRVYLVIDTLANLKATRNYLSLFQTVFIGFANVGPVSIGNIYTIVGKNAIQGWNFKLALRTSARLSKTVRIGLHGGYGLLDKKWRYGGEILWLIKKNPRISAFASYRFDIMSNPNASSFFTTPAFFTTYGLRRVENGAFLPYKLMDNREIKFKFYHEFKYGYSYTVGFKNQQLHPLGNFDFSYHTAPENLNPNTNIDAINITEFSLIQRFAWKERFVNNNFMRYSMGSKFPVLFFEYAFGVKRVIGSQFSYHRLAFGINDTRMLGPAGKIRLNLEVGKTFGTIPFLILHSPDATETYISWWPGFNTIPKYYFIADRYVKAEFDHHLGGALFDRIPGFNKLKWREVWSAKMWWGDLTPANHAANYANMADNPANTGLTQLRVAGKMPFIEMSAGIENIFSFFRIDAVWRVTHLDPNGTRFSFRRGNFGVRMAFEIQF